MSDDSHATVQYRIKDHPPTPRATSLETTDTPLPPIARRRMHRRNGPATPRGLPRRGPRGPPPPPPPPAADGSAAAGGEKGLKTYILTC